MNCISSLQCSALLPREIFASSPGYQGSSKKIGSHGPCPRQPDSEVVDKWQTHKTLQGPENSRHVARVQEDGKSWWDGTVREYCTEQVGFEPNLDE